MKGFMAIIFNMGLIKKWSKWLLVSQKLCNTPWFRIVMARDRFKKIRIFDIVDNSTISSKDKPAYRPSCRVTPLLDYVNTVYMYYFMPGQAIAIDESLIASKVRNPIRQYLLNKHHARISTKVWLFVDSKHTYIF